MCSTACFCKVSLYGPSPAIKSFALGNFLAKQANISITSSTPFSFISLDAVKKIIAAWLITVPAAAILAAMLFFTIKGIMI